MPRRKDPIKSKFKPDPNRRKDPIKSKFKPKPPLKPRPKLPGVLGPRPGGPKPGPRGPLKPKGPGKPPRSPRPPRGPNIMLKKLPGKGILRKKR